MSIKVTQASPKYLGLLSAARARRSSDQIGGRALAAGLSEYPPGRPALRSLPRCPAEPAGKANIHVLVWGCGAVDGRSRESQPFNLIKSIAGGFGWMQPILAPRFQIGCAVSPDITSLGGGGGLFYIRVEVVSIRRPKTELPLSALQR